MTTPPKPFLKPCPFCGPMPAEPELYQDDYGYWVVGCGPCGAHSGRLPQNERWPDAREQIIAAWNRRDGISTPTCERSPKWQPIETAPKDGTEIIIFHPEAGVCAAFCPKEGFAWHCMDGQNTVIGSKSGASIPAMTSFIRQPTHWMPLPEPPSAE